MISTRDAELDLIKHQKYISILEEFEDTKEVTKIVDRRTDNTITKKKKDKRTNDLQNIHVRLKNPTKNRG